MSHVIKVENLGKSYIIDPEKSERYTALRDVITNKFITGGKRIKSIFSQNNKFIHRSFSEGGQKSKR
jgi:homopolymeric O-antigen transport system ATP-binding protein